MKYIAALVQMTPVLGDVEKNISRHLEYIDQAIEGGASLVIFPELSLCGYTLRDLTSEVAMRMTDPRLERLRERSSEITIIAGGVEEEQSFGLYNSAFIFDRGTIHTHRKIYPPDYGLFEEGRYFLHGNSVEAVDTRCGRIGVLVCEDIWHLSLPLLLALDGAQAIIAIAASPTRLAHGEGFTNQRINSENHRVLARLLETYIIFVNRTGFEDGVNFWGGSEAVNAFGEIVVSAPLLQEELIFTEIDLQSSKRARQQARHFLDERPELLRHELERIAGKER